MYKFIRFGSWIIFVLPFWILSLFLGYVCGELVDGFIEGWEESVSGKIR